MPDYIRVADEVWIAAASLHLSHPEREDFTNDYRLNRKVIPGVHFIQSLATAVL